MKPIRLSTVVPILTTRIFAQADTLIQADTLFQSDTLIQADTLVQPDTLIQSKTNKGETRQIFDRPVFRRQPHFPFFRQPPCRGE